MSYTGYIWIHSSSLLNRLMEIVVNIMEITPAFSTCTDTVDYRHVDTSVAILSFYGIWQNNGECSCLQKKGIHFHMYWMLCFEENSLVSIETLTLRKKTVYKYVTHLFLLYESFVKRVVKIGVHVIKVCHLDKHSRRVAQTSIVLRWKTPKAE